MTAKTALEILRERVEAGTPGRWETWPNSAHYIRDGSRNGWGVLSVAHRPEPEADANAALIVTSHALARALVDEGTVEKVARATYQGIAPSWERQPEWVRDLFRANVRAVLNLLASLAVGDD
jgi:hypothetical protein